MESYPGFREFVVARGPALSQTAYLLTGDHHLAEELVQTALARTVRHWNRIAAAGMPEAYVRRVMVNEHTAWWRRRRLDIAAQAAVVAAATRVAETSDPADLVAGRVAVLAALAQLAPRQRAIVVLRFPDATRILLPGAASWP